MFNVIVVVVFQDRPTSVYLSFISA